MTRLSFSNIVENTMPYTHSVSKLMFSLQHRNKYTWKTVYDPYLVFGMNRKESVAPVIGSQKRMQYSFHVSHLQCICTTVLFWVCFTFWAYRLFLVVYYQSFSNSVWFCAFFFRASITSTTPPQSLRTATGTTTGSSRDKIWLVMFVVVVSLLIVVDWLASTKF